MEAVVLVNCSEPFYFFQLFPYGQLILDIIDQNFPIKSINICLRLDKTATLSAAVIIHHHWQFKLEALDLIKLSAQIQLKA